MDPTAVDDLCGPRGIDPPPPRSCRQNGLRLQPWMNPTAAAVAAGIGYVASPCDAGFPKTEGWFTQTSNLGNEREVRATGTDYPPCREPGPWTPSTDTKCPNEFVDQRREMYGNTGIAFRTEQGTKKGSPCDEDPVEGSWRPDPYGYCTNEDVNQTRTVTTTEGGVVSTTTEHRTVKGTNEWLPRCLPDDEVWGPWITVNDGSNVCTTDTWVEEQERTSNLGNTEYRELGLRAGEKVCQLRYGVWVTDGMLGDDYSSVGNRRRASPGDICTSEYRHAFYEDKGLDRGKPEFWALYCKYTEDDDREDDGAAQSTTPPVNPPDDLTVPW